MKYLQLKFDQELNCHSSNVQCFPCWKVATQEWVVARLTPLAVFLAVMMVFLVDCLNLIWILSHP